MMQRQDAVGDQGLGKKMSRRLSEQAEPPAPSRSYGRGGGKTPAGAGCELLVELVGVIGRGGGKTPAGTGWLTVRSMGHHLLSAGGRARMEKYTNEAHGRGRKLGKRTPKALRSTPWR